MEYKIPTELPQIIKPTIPFTNIPNPIGAGKLIYSNNVHQYIPLYYIQVLILQLRKILKRRLRRRKNKYKNTIFLQPKG